MAQGAPHINVTIAGKTYRMACAEGEETHLADLAADLDTRVGAMRRSFGEIGDMRLHVMAALTLSDELAEARRKAQAQDAEIARLRTKTGSIDQERAAEQARIAGGIDEAAERIERIARSLMAPRG